MQEGGSEEVSDGVVREIQRGGGERCRRSITGTTVSSSHQKQSEIPPMMHKINRRQRKEGDPPNYGRMNTRVCNGNGIGATNKRLFTLSIQSGGVNGIDVIISGSAAAAAGGIRRLRRRRQKGCRDKSTRVTVNRR